ncbi:hypothetical protein [Actibacterium sp. D379-3]
MRKSGGILLVVALCLGLIWPKASAVVSLLLPGTVQTIVICTGDGLVTVTIGPDGAPVRTGETEEAPCTIGTAVTADAAPLSFWQALARDHALRRPLYARIARSLPPYARRRPARAPPLVAV